MLTFLNTYRVQDLRTDASRSPCIEQKIIIDLIEPYFYYYFAIYILIRNFFEVICCFCSTFILGKMLGKTILRQDQKNKRKINLYMYII